VEGDGQETEEDGAGEPGSSQLPDPASLVGTLNHWLRRAVLRRVNVDGVLFSASDLAVVMDIPLNMLGYHVRCLETAGVLLEMDAVPVRGAYERIHTSQVPDNQIVALVLKNTEAEDIEAEQAYRDQRAKKVRKEE